MENRPPSPAVIACTAVLGLVAHSPSMAALQSMENGASARELNQAAAAKLLLSRVSPSYPPVARLNYIHGRVRVWVSVDAAGHVKDAHVMYGHPFLAAAALEAIHRWIYRPYRTASGPAEFQTRVDVNFSLRASNPEHVPPQPELDMQHQVQPPEVLDKEPGSPAGELVRLRILVNDEGRALDTTPLDRGQAPSAAARERIKHWKFRPAHWGNMLVPWYVDVLVPVDGWIIESGAKQPG